MTFSYLENEQAANDVVAEVTASGGRALARRCDQGEPTEMAGLYEAAEAYASSLEIVVNNAAAVGLGLIADVSGDVLARVVAVNLIGTFVSMREAARRLRDGGRIVNISTINTVMPGPGMSLYVATKAAVEQLSVVAAHELGPRGITVNTVSPGATDTEGLHAVNSDESLQRFVEMTPLRRLGTAEEVAAVVAFLVGPDGGWLSAQNIRAGGGIR